MPAMSPLKHGWLPDAPDSWLHLLIRQLPAKERLVLFQTCRSLAKHVVHNAPSVRLRFLHSRHTESAAVIEARREAIKNLLMGCPHVHMEVHTDKPVPLPGEIMGRINKVTLQHDKDLEGPASSNFDWNSLLTLHVLDIIHTVHDLDISRICDAVEAGQLPALHSITWILEPFHPGWQEDALMERFAKTMGKQTTNMVTNNHQLLLKLEQFVALNSITVHGRVSKGAMQQLCSHPTLRSVTFKGHNFTIFGKRAINFEGDYSQCKCNWQEVTFHCVDPEKCLRCLCPV